MNSSSDMDVILSFSFIRSSSTSARVDELTPYGVSRGVLDLYSFALIPPLVFKSSYTALLSMSPLVVLKSCHSGRRPDMVSHAVCWWSCRSSASPNCSHWSPLLWKNWRRCRKRLAAHYTLSFVYKCLIPNRYCVGTKQHCCCVLVIFYIVVVCDVLNFYHCL